MTDAARPAEPLLAAVLPTPVGPLAVVVDPRALGDLGPQPYGAVVASGFAPLADIASRVTVDNPRPVETDADLGEVAEAVQAWSAGDLHALDRVSVDQPGSPFRQAAWTALRSVPPRPDRDLRGAGGPGRATGGGPRGRVGLRPQPGGAVRAVPPGGAQRRWPGGVLLRTSGQGRAARARGCPARARGERPVACARVRLLVARCSVDYVGRLTAHLPEAVRLILVKADGSVLVHADGGSYKPLNWMSPPCRLDVRVDDDGTGTWTVQNRAGERLVIDVAQVLHDSSHDLGLDPGLVKDGVEAHLQQLLATHVTTLGAGWTLVRREYPTAIGPVDLMCRDAGGASVAVEVKRRGEIDGVEQLTRYLELLNRDPRLAPVAGVLAAQEIKPQARVLAQDRGIRCVVVDYDALRGSDDPGLRLF